MYKRQHADRRAAFPGVIGEAFDIDDQTRDFRAHDIRRVGPISVEVSRVPIGETEQLMSKGFFGNNKVGALRGGDYRRIVGKMEE